MSDDQAKVAEEIKDAKAPAAEAAAEGGAKAPAKRKRKAKAKAQIRRGRVYIQATYNNTIVTFTDQSGNVLGWSSAGINGFKGPKKSTPYAASIIVRNAVEKIQQYGLQEVDAFVRGVGSGREASLRAMHANGINVLTIKDITPIPHNGCRPPRPRRV